MKILYCLLFIGLAFISHSQVISTFPYAESCSDTATFARWTVDNGTFWYHDTTLGVIRATDHIAPTYSNLYSPWFTTTGMNNPVCHFMIKITPDSINGCVPELQFNRNDTANGMILIEGISDFMYHCAPTTDYYTGTNGWASLSMYIPLPAYFYTQYVFTANFLGTGDIQIKNIWIGDASQFVGINDIAENSFSVYPNPMKNEAHMRYELQGKCETQLRMVDMLGNVVYQTEPIQESGVITKEISTVNLASGIYVLQLKINGEVIGKKVMVE